MSRRASDEHTDADAPATGREVRKSVRSSSCMQKKSKPQKQKMNVDNDTASANELVQFGFFFNCRFDAVDVKTLRAEAADKVGASPASDIGISLEEVKK